MNGRLTARDNISLWGQSMQNTTLLNTVL
jgi:hypothetical protein